MSKSPGTGTLAGAGPVLTQGGTPGVAPFGEAVFANLTINALNTYTLTASASGVAPASAAGLRIVNDLEACDGTLCDNLASNTLVRSFGKIVTGSDFFNNGLQTNVLLNTALVPASDFTAKCGSGVVPFGNGSDVRVQGAGLGATAPTTTMVIVVPKETLKQLKIQSRSANSFNACLGALWINPDLAPSAWTTKGGGTAVVRDPTTDPLRYWGSLPTARPPAYRPTRRASPCAPSRSPTLQRISGSHQPRSPRT